MSRARVCVCVGVCVRYVWKCENLQGISRFLISAGDRLENFIMNVVQIADNYRIVGRGRLR